MKIRADFVTNSSSSSYVTLDIHSPLLAQMLEDYMQVLEQRGELPDNGFGEPGLEALDLAVRDGHIVCVDDEDEDYCDVPNTVEEVIAGLVGAFLEKDECRASGSTDWRPLVAAVKEHEEEVLDSIESVEWTYESSGWGGDSEDRIYHNYSDAEIDGFKDRIVEQKKWDAEWEAKRKGKSLEGLEFRREDVTEDEVRDYILRSTSNETTSFSYKKGKGPGTHTYSYELSQ